MVFVWNPYWKHEIIKLDAPGGDPASLNKKVAMLDLSPFDETLFLDIDTVVMGDLNFGFEKAKKFGMAIAICEAPWGKRYQKIFSGDEIEYNTGVIFFTKESSQFLFIFPTILEKRKLKNLAFLNCKMEFLKINK